jgi:mRNA interferase RelE/StbE
MRTWGFAFTSAALSFLEGVPHKERRQIIKKARALHANPFPPGCKKLSGVEADGGESVYRERSGDYRILYVVRQEEVIILDIDHRKDVYKMPSTSTKTNSDMHMSTEDFDAQMSKALGVAPPPEASQGTSKKAKPQKTDPAKTGRRKSPS